MKLEPIKEEKVLSFYFRNELYFVNKKGHIKANGLNYFSNDWIFLGGSSHHWNNHITTTLEEAWEKPELLNGCLGWDLDHGTTRQWGGLYNGKLPRIQGARFFILMST